MTSDLLNPADPDVQYFSRADVDEPFGTYSHHPFNLEQRSWPSVEHYFQAMKFNDEAYQERIRIADSPTQARKLGRTRLKRIRRNWKDVKAAYMTRAVYTKCRSYPDIARRLITNQNQLIENSLYDYFWGCGRDRRGKNMYGQVLMNVRDKLRQEAK